MTILILILIAIIVLAFVSYLFFKMADNGMNFACLLIGIITGMAAAFCAVLYVMLITSWVGAEHKARIINREYGTDYTAEEIFYASDVIDTIQQIKRKRIEVDGDLMRDQPDKD